MVCLAEGCRWAGPNGPGAGWLSLWCPVWCEKARWRAKQISQSSHVGIRRSDVSHTSDLFVAPMMKTFFLSDMPSISVRIWLMTLSAAPPASPAPPPLDLAMESSSSKNNMQGAACRAWGKRSRGQQGYGVKRRRHWFKRQESSAWNLT